MRLLGNRLLVEDLQTPLSTVIEIPDQYQPPPAKVRVLQVGSGVNDPALVPGVIVNMTQAWGFLRVPGRPKELIVSVRDVLCVHAA